MTQANLQPSLVSLALLASSFPKAERETVVPHIQKAQRKNYIQGDCNEGCFRQEQLDNSVQDKVKNDEGKDRHRGTATPQPDLFRITEDHGFNHLSRCGESWLIAESGAKTMNH